MDHDLGVDKKKDKRKIIKDLSFLLEKTAVPLHSNCAKYLLQEGKGEVLSDINEHFDIVYSLRQYDYEGRRINEYPEGKINNQSKKDIALIELLQTMRVKEKAWFNLSNQQIFRNQKKRSTYE